MVDFPGIPADAFAFYRELAGHNSRDWWAAHKARYAASVREPMEHLLDVLEDEFGAGKLFRPHRDIRFSADKSPYKDHQGAIVGAHPGMGWYVQVSAEGLLTGAGFYPTDPGQVKRLRAAVDAPASGVALAAIVAELEVDGFELAGEQVATRPRGVAADHPRLELMRYKNIIALTRHGEPSWIHTPEVADRVRADWRKARPLIDWLGEHIGADPA